MSWDTAMWFGAGFALTVLIAVVWDLLDYERERRKSRRRMRSDWAGWFEKKK
jgi:hypothetical protein